MEEFCCRGCEYVYSMIHSEGLDHFYKLRQNKTLAPVKSTPFEPKDFEWLEKIQDEVELLDNQQSTAEADFSAEGVSCVGCVWLIENVYKKHRGAIDIQVHPTTGKLHLTWEKEKTDLVRFAHDLADFGYRMTPYNGTLKNTESASLIGRIGLCGAFALNAMVFTLPSYLGMPEDFAFARIFTLVALFSASLSLLVGGLYFIKRAWKSARSLTPHIDLPIALGILFAFGGSIAGWMFEIEGLMYFDFVATFIFLMLLGRFIQVRAVEKNRNRLRQREPIPQVLSSPDHEGGLPLGKIQIGSRIEIRPGNFLPMASKIECSAAEFSLEWITGEAEPKTFQAGRTVPAGASLISSTPVLLRAEETWADSILSRLTESKRNASRAPTVERILKWYLAIIVLTGVMGFAFWISAAGFPTALQVMISVFVVSCPCALGVALPLADDLAGAKLERSGVFVRDSMIWTKLRQIRKIIFDKTGTLTLERPVLQNPEAISELTDDAHLALARLTENSLHPVCRSLKEALGATAIQELRKHSPSSVEDHPGKGRRLICESATWTLGKPGWSSDVMEMDHEHDTELCLDGKIMARFRFHESLRPDTEDTIRDLRQTKKLFILSGDREEKVNATARLLGLSESEAHANLLPEQKEQLAREINQDDTLYIGDGANDSLAFNVALVTGTPVVDQSVLEQKSDFFFLGQSLKFLPELFKIADRRHRSVVGVFTFTIIYNLAAVTAALAGWMNPLTAAIIMPFSSVISVAIITTGLKGKRPNHSVKS